MCARNIRWRARTNILGSGYGFAVKVHRGAGAFVSGESSALMSAIEGKVGEPRMKYVHTAVSGIKGRPSNLNNVETWATVPLIIDRGADWFRSIGTEGSKGTKIFSLVGKVNNTGLVEIPMGMTLREIIYGIGGGIIKGKRFKGVQTGGPSGGILPEQCLDTPVDFDELDKLGSMMGSGGMVVMDEDTCMVDVARYFVNFLCEESCGKCIPCREGLRVLRQVLTDICEGRGKPEDIAVIREIAEVMADASLCALGTTAANPVLTTLRYFGDEYEAHIRDKRCPARFCKSLTSYCIDPEKCTACLICLRNCPASAVVGDKGIVHWIDQEKCTKCGVCFEVCPDRFNAVLRISGEPVPAPVPPIVLKIDGREVSARPGRTILETAGEAGIEIPALCHHRKTKPYGACRICSVEAEKDGKVKIIASCGYPAEPGLVIRTRSPRIDRIRRAVLELVAPQAMLDGDFGGDLKKLADEYGADIHRFEARLQVKSQRCILCGLCVRYCDEVVGAHAIGFVGRGIDRRVLQDLPHRQDRRRVRRDLFRVHGR